MKLSVLIFFGLLSYSSMKTYKLQWKKEKVRFTELIVTCFIQYTGVFIPADAVTSAYSAFFRQE